jgi:ribosomal protein L9
MVYRNKSDIDTKDLSIGILYANSKTDNANSLKEELEAKGMEVKMQSSDALSKNYIAVHNLDIAGDTITELKKTIPSLKDNHTIYDPIGINRAGKDITIVISDL